MVTRRWRWLIGAVALVALAAGGTASASASASGSAPGTQLWAKSFTGGAGRTASATDLAVSPDQPVVYVTGGNKRTAAAPHTHDSTLAYNTATGARLWLATYKSSSGSHPDGVPVIAVSADGSRVFVLDNLGMYYHSQTVVLAYDAATGSQIWASNPGPISQWGQPKHIAVSPDGSQVFITGAGGRIANTGYYTIALDAASGQRTWQAFTSARWGGGGGTSIAVSGDSSEVFVTGRLATVAYSASTGAQLWFDKFNLRWGRRGSLAVSPDSSTVYLSTPSSSGPLVIAYNARTGAQLWVAQSGGGAIAVSPDGSSLFVTTPSETIAYEASTGAGLWTASSGGQSIAVSHSGSQVFVTGPTGSGSSTTIGYDVATGNQLWATTINSFFPVVVGVSPNGSQAIVTGSGAAPNGTEYLTVAYQA